MSTRTAAVPVAICWGEPTITSNPKYPKTKSYKTFGSYWQSENPKRFF